ncbi:MAG: bifunctional isocitrate dehydrogenase kinase/phosphatase, partial [Chromatiales bacterium]
AATNIFPGDLLSKNFGVTRHGRVIFYDYDELCLITDCRFREMPQARSYEDEMRSDAWFYVGEDDVFPEQFLTFLGLDEEGKQIFAEYHGELISAEWWRNLQTRLRADEVIEIVPYSKLRPTVSLASG